MEKKHVDNPRDDNFLPVGRNSSAYIKRCGQIKRRTYDQVDEPSNLETAGSTTKTMEPAQSPDVIGTSAGDLSKSVIDSNAVQALRQANE
ncbi:hypothetical protein T265_10290 [Opisthorchis viverrini]|uniref:Uncharacterized protein n=1 Tax=Opisthorchis viverrini TaxID=6198 RepID=A0A074Z734_OPIVI|nr:hypothetical protein T265_10290 [Opisthorchis viverrini]KER21387.1 hypothetical protein T265_10290 [Opisthorchis viverrini]